MSSLVMNAKPWSGLKRVIMAPDQSRVGYLHPDDSNKWEDGTDVNWSSIESSGYNVMVEVPKFYFTKVDGDTAYFGVADSIPDESSVPKDKWQLHPAFFRDRDGDGVAEEVDFRYYAAFEGWVDGNGKLRSLPFKEPTVNETIGTFRTYGENNGTGWGIVDYNLLYAIQILYITEFAHPDSQTVIGKGITSDSAKHNTGETLSLGNHTGNADNDGISGKKAMSYRGIENWYGNVFKWIDGIVTDSSYNILIGDVNFNDSGSGYTTCTTTNTSNTGGYINDIQPHLETGFIMKSSGGSNSSKLYDYGYLASGRVCRFGGSWSYASDAGAFYLRLSHYASSVDLYVGASLSL